MTDLAQDAPWLTPASSSWRITRLAYVASAIQTGPFGSQLHSEDYVEGGVPLINPSHIREGILLPKPEDSISESTAQRLSRHRMREGEVVFGRRGELGRCAVVRPEHHGWLCGTGSMLVRPIAALIDAEYLQLAASLSGAREWLQLQSVGSTMDNLNASILGRLPLPLPEISAQRGIVRALRSKTVTIDALIAKKERLIELLQEKRQTLITQAVTKGLDATVPMRESGVPWLGLIPAHWSFGELRRRWRIVDCKHTTPSYVDDGFPLVSTTEVKPGRLDLSGVTRRVAHKDFVEMTSGGRLPQQGDIIYSRNASLGSAAFVDHDDPFCMGQDVVRIWSRDQSQLYLAHVLNGSVGMTQVELVCIGTTFKRINVSQIGQLVVPLPPPAEQCAIAQWVDRTDIWLGRLTRKIALHVEKLREYRQALITAAVTGKIDVSKEAA